MQKKYIVIIIFWIALISVSLSARQLLFTNVSQSTSFTQSNTQAALGSDLIKQRFNVTSQSLVQILVLEAPKGQDLTSNTWRNYTLALTQYINDTLFKLGYDQIFSEPYFYLLNQQLPGLGFNETEQSFISSDHKDSIINIIDTQADIHISQSKLQADVEILRDLVSKDNITKGIVAKAQQMSISNYLPTTTLMNSINVLVTGEPANFVDILKVSEQSFQSSEVLAVILAVIVLGFVFRSPLGIVIPLISMVASLFPSYLLTALLAKTGLYDISSFLPSVIGMVGIAVAIDYNLFALVRFREEYRKRKAEHLTNGTWDKTTRKETREIAANITNKTSGVVVMYSGFTVIIGFMSLLVLGSDFTLGIAIAVSIVVATSILSARTLTVTLLAVFGDILDWPNIMSRASKDIERTQGKIKDNGSFWVKWSHLVMKRPLTFLILGLLIMTPFIILSTQTEISFDLVKQLPKNTESRQGFEILQSKFSLGSIYPYQIVLDLGNNTNFFASSYSNTANQIIQKINQISTWALSYSGVYKKDNTPLSFDSAKSVSVFQKPNGNYDFLNYTSIINLMNSPDAYPIIVNSTIVGFLPNIQKLQFMTQLKQYVNLDNGNNTIIIDFTSNLDAGTAAAWQLVSLVREEVSSIFKNFTPVKKIYVTGFASQFKDSSDDLYNNVPKMLVLAVILIFISLMILFRSLILPAKAILTISGSILFGLGTLVFIFQEGHLLGPYSIFGYTIWEAETSGVTFFIPAFIFTIILGLGMDYTILIISRIKEEYLKSGDMGQSVGIGLGKTAGVVTSAATVMIATFFVFALSPILVLKTMGVAMAVAILVDATVARIIILPAAMKLLGRVNWWLPKWLDRIIPDLHFSH